MEVDVLIKGGRIVSPGNGIDQVGDVAIHGGRIVAVDRNIEPSSTFEIVDATGLLVTPGLIDIHTHIYCGVTYWGIDHRALVADSGVTTWVDAGSAGAHSLDGFCQYIATPSPVNVYAFLNLSSIGLIARTAELASAAYCDPSLAASVASQNRGRVVGIKARLSGPIVGANVESALMSARAAGDGCGLPLMVHVGDEPPAIDAVLDLLGDGDIVTHYATGKTMCLLRRDGSLRSSVVKARDRGVLFDVGHGSASFSFDVAEGLLANGIAPDTISSDLHRLNASLENDSFGLAECLSKYLAIGMPLHDVIAAATSRAASAIGLQGEHGVLAAGRRADVAVWELQQGHYEYFDVNGEMRQARVRLRNLLTISAGEVLREDRGSAAPGKQWVGQRRTID